MHHKLQTRAFQQVAPLLQAGEQPVVATRASVGSFSSGRLGAVVKQTLIAEGAGALGAALSSSTKQFVVLTTHRMIFLSQTLLGGPGRKVLGELPRGHAVLAEAKWGMVSLLRIAFGDSGDGVAMTFPRVDRKNAEALAAALQQSPTG
ncbi:hypothetical protein [Actinoplanes teichomyceticus]|uniref:PH (Pleckstrin Homology) domain-containing protein n=1 Tax=Actinoplanes teichomyceticus TaxID=1867 RepID=A0A561VRW8_ACTTI|nr:hypothetical protein [Actinoplanes teichomyceticus]TWG14375.1 hypothetical protein FHX34_104675 [Actinoplanes teichomyceticus]GIF13065.1 hypothetical protein Ate01nite_30970 [Actinoplanes teichomyceticus]